MDQSNHPISENLPLGRLVMDALGELERLGYSRRSRDSRLAGITFRSPQKRGIHSLRHSLATRLLEQGTPFPTIADILGHTSLESTRIYAKADVEALRSVALDTEEVNHAE